MADIAECFFPINSFSFLVITVLYLFPTIHYLPSTIHKSLFGRTAAESDASGAAFEADGDVSPVHNDWDPADAAGEFQHFGEFVRFSLHIIVSRFRVRRPGAIRVRSSVFSVDRNLCHCSLLQNMSS